MRPILYVLIALALSGCTAKFRSADMSAGPAVTRMDNSNQAKSIVKRAGVELDIFSGRPNPTWILSSGDTEKLVAMIEKLPHAEPVPLFDGLGYRGFIVTFPTPTAGTNSVTVYKEAVKLSAADFRNDPERTIERWLLAKAKSVLKKEDYEVAEEEIEAVH